ncbi:MAG TPA: HEPN domain-containing protein [Vicinamibacteria bacterium]|nr:HEPN domain-containing protein [Vicinamibacteria bacterium]
MNRWRDWREQSYRDLRHAENARDDDDFEWSAFAAQQSAEKALEGLIMEKGGEPWGHSVTGLAEALPAGISAPADILEAARRLDKHYTRYPNGFAEGYPGKFYTRGEAEGAIADASQIIEFCRSHPPRSG